MEYTEATAEDATLEPPSKKPRNAFTELMQRKTPTKTTQSSDGQYSPVTTNSPDNFRDLRNGLGVYIKNPAAHPDTVVNFDDDWVLIKDRYPKGVVHLLLITRDRSIFTLRPQAAIDSRPEFLAKLHKKAEECLQIAASELSRILSPHSASCQSRRLAMTSEDPPAELPPGRDYTKDIKMGFHAGPSMNHLHLHIISVESWSPCVKHHKHYNSFNTDFFLPLDQFPYAPDDARRTKAYQITMLQADFVCWRCGKNFGVYNSKANFERLKKHLDEEFKAWRLE